MTFAMVDFVSFADRSGLDRSPAAAAAADEEDETWFNESGLFFPSADCSESWTFKTWSCVQYRSEKLWSGSAMMLYRPVSGRTDFPSLVPDSRRIGCGLFVVLRVVFWVRRDVILATSRFRGGKWRVVQVTFRETGGGGGDWWVLVPLSWGWPLEMGFCKWAVGVEMLPFPLQSAHLMPGCRGRCSSSQIRASSHQRRTTSRPDELVEILSGWYWRPQKGRDECLTAIRTGPFEGSERS